MSTNQEQRVTIGGEEYIRETFAGRFGPSNEYFVVRVQADGRRVRGHLNPRVHRHAIARVEAAIQRAAAAN